MVRPLTITACEWLNVPFFSTENERLVGVFGRAGPQSYYKQDKVNNISFVIFDTAKGTTRVEGVSTCPLCTHRRT